MAIIITSEFQKLKENLEITGVTFLKCRDALLTINISFFNDKISK